MNALSNTKNSNLLLKLEGFQYAMSLNLNTSILMLNSIQTQNICELSYYHGINMIIKTPKWFKQQSRYLSRKDVNVDGWTQIHLQIYR
jgi:hypothetical protein